MNKSNNIRYKTTDLKIENALLKLLKDKDFNSIYINDICKESGIARTSFYSHYDDINDLILKIQYKYSNDIIDILVKNKVSFKDAFTKYFYYLKDHSFFYKALLMSSESAIFKKTTHDYMSNLYSKLTQHIDENKRPTKYHLTFVSAGIKSIAYKWILDGCAETPEEMAKIILQEYTYLNSN